MSIYFIVVLAAVVLITIAIFPLAYPLLNLIPGVANYPGDRVMSRLVILAIFSATLIIYPRLKLPPLGLWRPGQRGWWAGFKGMVLGILAAVLFLGYAAAAHGGTVEFYRFSPAGNPAALLIWYLIGVITVAVLEETFFRGIAFNLFYRDTNSAGAAIMISALFFAVVHFINWPALVAVFQSGTGWQQLLPPLTAGTDLDKFLILFLLGAVLAYAYRHSGTLYTPIGIHAGLVLMIRIAGKVFVRADGGLFNIFYLSSFDIAALVVILAGMVHLIPRVFPRRPRYKLNLTVGRRH